MTAICGDSCSILVGIDDTFLGHKFTINTSSPDNDVRTFGSGTYGDWLNCIKEGTISLNCYNRISGVTNGDVATVTCNVNSEIWTFSNCVCRTQNCDVDAKGIVEFVYEFRITGDPTGWGT
jgi:hypothetical protein